MARPRRNDIRTGIRKTILIFIFISVCSRRRRRI